MLHFIMDYQMIALQPVVVENDKPQADVIGNMLINLEEPTKVGSPFSFTSFN
jgi:hypothetical protein